VLRSNWYYFVEENAVQQINRIVTTIAAENHNLPDDVMSSTVIYIKNFSNSTLKKVQLALKSTQDNQMRLDEVAKLLALIRILI
jgi:hypothetical protein